MDTFSFLFALFSLLIGLAMAEILGDLGRVIDRRKTLRIGWHTPLLAVLVLCDLTSFWQSAYDYRDLFKDTNYAVFAITAFAALYYLIATLVIPEDPQPGLDLDDHYAANNRIVVGGIFLLNLPNIPLTVMAGGNSTIWTIAAIFYALLAGLFFVKSKKANVAMLLSCISIYAWGPLSLGFIS